MTDAFTPVAPYGSSAVFDEHSLPDSLRNKHSTKAGTWGLLRVMEGEVGLVFLDPPSQRLVTVDDPAPIPPQSKHFVKLVGPMKMQVEFYRQNPLGADEAGN
ncbi:DUF1971 domain-containing protein [Parasphingorhabdus sp.]|uniref:DUF1971 domain-containing protein n=1 Tax=Parasphingorhabdus sp. TaxID=2709688 RepID=UPI003C760AB3